MPLPIFVAVGAADAHPRRTGIRLLQSNVTDAERQTVSGLPVTSPLRTIYDLARWLGLLDLVVVLDGLLHVGHLRAADLACLASLRRCRGARVLRRGVSYADGRSESAYETLLRLLHVLCEFSVQPQVNLYDDAGIWLARADLLIEGTRRLPEYDGATHRDRERHESDLARDKRLGRAGYERYGYTAKELLGSPDTIVADAEDALGWPRRLDRVAGWLVEYRKSLFYQAARERFAARWCR
jgi:very-short-patch-repair endonuclease